MCVSIYIYACIYILSLSLLPLLLLLSFLLYIYVCVCIHVSIFFCANYIPTLGTRLAPSSRHTRRPRRRWTKCRADCMAQQPGSGPPKKRNGSNDSNVAEKHMNRALPKHSFGIMFIEFPSLFLPCGKIRLSLGFQPSSIGFWSLPLPQHMIGNSNFTRICGV